MTAATVLVRADRVAPGDVVHRKGFAPAVVSGVRAELDDSRMLVLNVCDAQTGAIASEMVTHRPDEYLAVEVCQRLTPAQQHAEELLALVRETVAHGGHAATLDAMRTLLTHIEPPKPPTAEELARALHELTHAAREQSTVESHMHQPIAGAAEMIKRARAAGLLP